MGDSRIRPGEVSEQRLKHEAEHTKTKPVIMPKRVKLQSMRWTLVIDL
jgi:hypothetical protein